MKRLFLLASLVLLLASPVIAQSDDEDDYFDDDIVFDSGMNMAGDQYIKIALGLSVPLNFPDVQSLFEEDGHQLSLGGVGTLGYHYFLKSWLAVGFDVGFGFNVTIGSHVLNYVPFIFSATYQPTWKKLEFPITVGVGFAWESYNSYNYFPGLVLKPEAGVHYRLTSSWSVGVEASYMWMPQFNELYGNGSNYYGQFFDIGLAARYLF